jgi:iron complex transport system ATP-binding protein
VTALLQKLHEARGLTILISTHDLALAGALCRRVLLLRDGLVLAEGTTDATLTPENVRRLYGVEVDVLQHASGRRVLVPIGRSADA